MIKREDAFSLFEKWRSEECPVSCVATLIGLGFTLTGRIAEFSENGMSIASTDGQAKFFIGFSSSDGLLFEYEDSLRALPHIPPGEVKIVSGVGIALPSRREKVYVFELVREIDPDTQR
jgi:hypothetical protein